MPLIASPVEYTVHDGNGFSAAARRFFHHTARVGKPFIQMEEDCSASEEEDAYHQDIISASTVNTSSAKFASDADTTAASPSNGESFVEDCSPFKDTDASELRSNFEPAVYILGSDGSTKPDVHPTARVSSGAVLGKRVVIEPYSVVESGAVLHDGVHVLPHAIVRSCAEIGKDSQIFSFADVGRPGQHRSSASSLLKIGERCHIREYAVIENGATNDSGEVPTIIADDCLIMASTTVRSGAQLERKAVVANQSLIGSGSVVSAGAIVGGRSHVYPGVVVGRGAMVGGLSHLCGHVMPHGLASGKDAVLRGLNLIGLRRSGTSKDEIRLMQDVFQYIFEPSVTQSLTRNRFYVLASCRPYGLQDRLTHVLARLHTLPATPHSPSTRPPPSDSPSYTISTIPTPYPHYRTPSPPALLDQSREATRWVSSVVHQDMARDAQPLSLARVQEMLDFLQSRVAQRLTSASIPLLSGYSALFST